MTKATDDELHALNSHLQRSTRYHRARERFFDGWSNTFSFLSLLAGSSVVVSLLASGPDWLSIGSGAAVAVMQALEQVFRLSHKARDHSGLAAEFMALERVLVMTKDPTEDDVQNLKGDILSIETREPPIKRYVDLICHNQVAKAIGSKDTEQLTWFQRTFAHYISGDQALQN